MKGFSDEARAEWRAHWPVVIGTGLGMATCYALFSYVSSLFVRPLEAEFGWTRGEQANWNYASLVAACLAPVIGAYIDKIGVRRILLPAICIVGLVYIALANMTGSLAQFYMIKTVLALVGIATTGLAFTRAVTSWFSVSRGLALAVSRLGLAIGGATAPPIVYLMIEKYGSTGGFYTLAAFALFISFPLSWFLVSDKRNPAPGAHNTSNHVAGWQLWPTLLRNRRVLTLCVAAGLTYGPAVGLLSQLQPLLIAKQIDPSAGSKLVSLLAISTFVGVAVTGMLIDRVWAPLLGFLFTIGPVIGCFVLMSIADPGIYIAGAAVILIGLAQGAEIDLAGYMIARYFGMRSFAAIYGLTVLAIGTSSSIGAILIGHLYDRTGSYDMALAGAGIGFLIAALAYPFMGRYPDNPDEALTRKT